MACDKCKYCGNRYHWSHAFSKFDYDDPTIYLPEDIQVVLNKKIPFTGVFPY